MLAIGICLVKFEPVFTSSKDDQEPVCSKYHFEEKVLEKLVRMEHRNAIMMEEFNDIKTKVGEGLAGVNTETKYIKETLKEEKEKLKQDRDELKRSLAEEKDKLAKMLEGEIQKYSQTLNQLQSKSVKSSYAFSAHWLPDTSLSKGKTLVFSKTIFDEEQTYDNSSGKYTVPFSGTYLFTAHLCIFDRHHGEIYFVADGIRFGAFYVVDKDWYVCAQGTAIGQLQKGAKVWLKADSTAAAYNADDPSGFNYFAGYLINKNRD